jgi:DNA replication protein DnaC
MNERLNAPQSDGANGKRKLAAEDLTLACLPRRFWNARFRDIPDGVEYKDLVRKYLAKIDEAVRSGIGLMLWGGPGSGKTGAASVCLKYALRSGFTGLYVTAEDLRHAFREKEEFDDDVTLVERAQIVDVLLLDDLGKEFRTRAGNATVEMENLIRKRVQDKKTLLITTTADVDEAETMFGVGLMSMLTEAVVPVRVYGVDWREKKAEELLEFLGE